MALANPRNFSVQALESLEDLYRASDALVELAGLEEGWDGQVALPPTRVAIARAYDLMIRVHGNLRQGKTLGAPELCAPIPDGGLQLEWQGAKWRVEVQVAPDGSFGYLLVGGTPNDRRYEEADGLHLEEILRVVRSALLAK